MKLFYFLALLLITFPANASDQNTENILYIYQDADLSNHAESSTAIQKGIEVAFDEIGNEIAGHKIKFKYLDHRGNVVRSKQNYQTFISDPNALAIYSGIHSPPLIKNRTYINENKALTLVPWAAGGPVTRHPSKENWIFRLSLDDTRAGPVIVNFAVENKSCKAPHLLLEDTPWGDSNLKSMSKALAQHGMKSPSVTRFGWNLKEQGARIIVRDIIKSGSDCIVLVSNAVEGSIITNTVLNLPKEQRIPIISHWGITGGNFHDTIDAKKRKNIDLSFIQTCFAFTNSKQTDFSKEVFSRLTKITNNEIKEAKDLKSAVGFIHAYDLTKLLINAINQIKLTGDIAKDRDLIRQALENLNSPIQGLVKTYQKPFSIFDAKNTPNAHEALDENDFCMARYGQDNEILIIK